MIYDLDKQEFLFTQIGYASEKLKFLASFIQNDFNCDHCQPSPQQVQEWGESYAGVLDEIENLGNQVLEFCETGE